MTKRVVFTVLLVACGLGAAYAPDLTGTVRSKAGKPLAGVVVFSKSFKPSETDAAGRFRLRGADQVFPAEKRVVFFSGAGFRPLLKVIDGRDGQALDVELEESAGAERAVPACARDSGRRAGVFLRFPVPKGAALSRGRDVDVSDFQISRGAKGGRGRLYGLSGPRATYGYPSDEWVLAARELTLRPWKSGTFEGLDARGRTADGGRWRYFGMYGEAAMYSDANEEEAAFLDRIIDGVCLAAN